MSLGTVSDRDLEMARLAEVDAWYDEVFAAAKRADPSATMVKHDTLASLVVGGHSVLLTGSMWYGAQQTGLTPNQLVAKYMDPSYVEPTYMDYPSLVQTAPLIPGLPTGNTGPSGILTPAPQATTTVLNSLLQQTASTLGLDATQSSWLEQNKWLVLGGAAVAAWFMFARKK